MGLADCPMIDVAPGLCRCPRCGRKMPCPLGAARAVAHCCSEAPANDRQESGCDEAGQTTPFAHGPGSELAALLHAAGIPTCGKCNDLARQMDAWGADGCRDRIDGIMAGVQVNFAQQSLREKLSALAAAPRLAITLGLRLDPLHPIRSLVEEAIRRAAAPPT